MKRTLCLLSTFLLFARNAHGSGNNDQPVTEDQYEEMLDVLEKNWLYPINRKGIHGCAIISRKNGMHIFAQYSAILSACFEQDRYMSILLPNTPVVAFTTRLHMKVIPSRMRGVVFGAIDMTKNVPEMETMTSYFSKTLARVRSARVGGFLINLSNNEGGYSNGAAAFLRFFAPAPTPTASERLLFETRGRDGTVMDEVDRYVSSEPGIAQDRCVAVLVNKNTASAAEVIAYVLQTWGARVFGEITFKKGTAQIPLPLQNGAVLVFTYGRVFFADGTTTDKHGVIPDFITNDEHTQWKEAFNYLHDCHALK